MATNPIAAALASHSFLEGMDPQQLEKLAQLAFEVTFEPDQLIFREGDPVSLFLPGQFSMLYVYGVGELPISISGDLERREQLTYTIRRVGQVTYHLVTRKPGDQIELRGPFGSNWPMREAR